MHDNLLARFRFWVGTKRSAIDPSRALRRAAARAVSATEIVEAAFTVPAGDYYLGPAQIRSELAEFIALVNAELPRRVLEVGTSKGGTLYALAWASADDARILSLDIQEYDRRRLELYRSFARVSQTIEVQHADSQSESTRRMVDQFFAGESLDVLFIDGNHAYEGVRRDYELYSPLVRSGGLIALHDIVEGPADAVGGVPRFWREVQASLVDPKELVESWTQGGFGIGVGRRR